MTLDAGNCEPNRASRSTGRLARNTLYNSLGHALPIAVALVAIPPVIDGLGTVRFGLLTLAWMVIGYLSLFDLGMGRALTKLVAEKLALGREDEVASLVWHGLVVLSVLAIVASVVLVFCARWLAWDVLNIPPSFRHETVVSMYVLAGAIPVVILSIGLIGVLEGYQLFQWTSLVRAPMGCVTFAGPLVVLPVSHSLVAVVAVLALGRLLATIAYAWLCLRAVRGLGTRGQFDWPQVRTLLGFGGWIAVSNVISRIMIYVDRFVIGAVLSVAVVAYYTTPFEVITKILVVPGAVAGVLLPSFSTASAVDSTETVRLLDRGLRYVLLAIFPLTLAAMAVGHEGLLVWLGREFAEQGTPVLRWLAVGVLLNGLAQVPFALLQGSGRADVTAKLHAFEVPCYLLLLWILTVRFGISGAAAAWTARVGLDLVGLTLLTRWNLRLGVRPFVRPAIFLTAALLCMGAAAVPQQLLVRSALLGLLLSAFAVVGWRYLLDAEERGLLRARIPPIAARLGLRVGRGG